MHAPVIALLLGAAPALPPPLVEALRAGQRHSHPLAIAKAQAEQARGEVQSTLSTLLPTFNAQGNYLRNQYQTAVDIPLDPNAPPTTVVLQPYNQLTASLSLAVPLFNLGALERNAQARHARDAAVSAVASSERDTQLSIARAYYTVVGTQGLLEAARKAVETADRNERTSSLKLNQGTINALALDKAKGDTAAARGTLAQAMRDLAVARRNLSTLTAMPEQADLPPPTDPGLPERDEEALVAQALEKRPEVQAARDQLAQARAGRVAAWGTLAPTVSGTATENLSNAAGFVGQSAYWTLGVGAGWSLDPLLTAGELRKSDGEIAAAEERLAQTLEGVRDEVHTAWVDLLARRARTEQARAQVAFTSAALKRVELRLEEGVANQLEVSQAQTDAYDAESSLAQAEAEYAYSALALRRAAGELLIAP
jgi:outer membrane protein TolC